jgi:CRP/FNR family transcriptional regulator, cyclic AMP receptor protein
MTQGSFVSNLQDLIKDGQAEKFEAGSVIFEEGTSSQKMYVLLQGQVRVSKNYNKTRIPLAVLGPGEIVGELALFDETPRSASVIAITSVVALAVNTRGLQEKISPPWILPVLQVVVERLRLANQTLANLQHLNEFSKKAFKRDLGTLHVLAETLRFCKTLRTFLKGKQLADTEAVSPESYLATLDEVAEAIQSDLVNGKNFLQVAKLSGLIDENENLRSETLGELIEFLEAYAQKENPTLPSHSCLRLIEKLISTQDITSTDSRAMITLNVNDSAYENMPLYKEALIGLKSLPFVIESANSSTLSAEKSELVSFWVHMRFIKSFDYADISL